MSSLWVAVALVVAPAVGQTPASNSPTSAAPAAEAAARKPHELRAAVSSAMRRAANTAGAEREAAIRELVALHEELLRDTQLVKEERIELRATVRNRLVKLADQVKVRSKREAKPAAGATAKTGSPANANLPSEKEGVLAQQVGIQQGFGFGQGLPGQGGANGGGQAKDHGQELVELIQATIAPTTWDVNGGLGTIMYFSPLHVIVVRQTGEVHDGLGDLMKQLHK